MFTLSGRGFCHTHHKYVRQNSTEMQGLYVLFTEVTIPMEDISVLLREEGMFFCQVMGNDPKLRIDGQDTALPYNAPGDLVITVENATSVDSMINVYNISITITATKKRNNTLLECYDQTMSREDASKAILIVQGIM